ncbi:hypothetical protein DL768_008903 [Monosporascus sp. mg162]|nr:hypothetical protein DL768_008903 [Monosporascus sp. mg162]
MAHNEILLPKPLAALSGPDEKTYHVPGDESLADWENATFKVHAPGVTAEKLFSAVERAALITLHFLPNAGTTSDTHQLVLQAEHQNIDSRGMYYCFNRFFTVFTTSSMHQDIHFGDEWSRPPPPMMDNPPPFSPHHPLRTRKGARSGMDISPRFRPPSRHPHPALPPESPSNSQPALHAHPLASRNYSRNRGM